jgi:lipopolysaccharide transport system ATP-binding protein
MSNIAIRVENLGKQYRIGGKQKNRTFREVLLDSFAAPVRWMRGKRRGASETFWALNDISFEIKKGEAVGIIGRNGAGKSTLLKILSRITKPTKGRVDLYGRVASLLEVGTGFHGELSGRDNIYLNGAILGMSRREINRKFDEIVDFSGVEKFLDTPVKHYSSGMYVRLAFAVAAHLEPEILVVDEVLAVGDAEFQKKCLGKMEDVTHHGRTVLFVSHNMSAISTLCNRAFLLNDGSLLMAGNTVDVITSYLSGIFAQTSSSDLSNVPHYGNGKARFIDLKIQSLDSTGHPASLFLPGDDLNVEAKIKAYEPVVEANVAIIIYDTNGYRIIDANSAIKNRFVSLSSGDEISVQFILKDVLLKPDKYFVGLWIGRQNMEDIDGITYARSFSVEIDAANTQHSQIFPGIYQCKYDIQIGGKS